MFELFVIGSVGTKSKINIIVSFQSGTPLGTVPENLAA